MFSFLKRKRNNRSEPKDMKPSVSFFLRGNVVSDIGYTRSNNEDNFVFAGQINCSSEKHIEFDGQIDPRGIACKAAGVFDGMGGGELGEVASRIAAEVFRNGFETIGANSSKSDIDCTMRHSFQSANDEIISNKGNRNILGTTGTVICTIGTEFKLYHLGDSRAYLWREGKLHQLTRDQTLAQMKIDSGLMQADDPKLEADRHKLTDYIGRDPTGRNTFPIESVWNQIEEGDFILLCSDGLYDMCDDATMQEVLGQKIPDAEKVSKLVSHALSNGGNDNITCILISFQPMEEK